MSNEKTETVKTPGQIAFEAYNESKGGLTYDGKPIPPWSSLEGQTGDAVKLGWEKAAQAVENALLIGLDHKPDELLLRARGAVRVFVKGGREQALTLTKIDEARHWLADATRPADGEPKLG